MWIYGSGFPKSLNIGKEVDKKLGNERVYIGENNDGRKGNNRGFKREYVGSDGTGKQQYTKITKGTSPFEGWGTGLKPANEPICLARKPIEEKTITDNVLKYGTGGINIDGCRIGTTDNLSGGVYSKGDIISNPNEITGVRKKLNKEDYIQPEGRFPSNFIIDEEASKLLDEQSGESKSVKRKKVSNTISKPNIDFGGGIKNIDNEYVDTGGVSRFFYIPKTSKKERELGIDNEKCKTTHPTIKPIDLMRYLVRLVTPKGGVIMDPFMGSGSTGVAALLESFQFVGIELDENYFEIALQRVNNHEKFSQFFEEKEIKKEKTKSKSKKKNPSDDPKLGFWAGQGLRMAS
jgi:site-specific DNA-methyltransferase (adenine-specific)